MGCGEGRPGFRELPTDPTPRHSLRGLPDSGGLDFGLAEEDSIPPEASEERQAAMGGDFQHVARLRGEIEDHHLVTIDIKVGHDEVAIRLAERKVGRALGRSLEKVFGAVIVIRIAVPEEKFRARS